MWSEEQIRNHCEVAKLLLRIKDLAFDFIREKKGVNELEVQEFILERFSELGLVSDSDPPIVAFGINSCNVHYYPGEDSRALEDGDLVMIDTWARLNVEGAPFADITWMGFRGEVVPDEILKIWDVVLKVRDDALECIGDDLDVSGRDVHSIFKRTVIDGGFGEKEAHALGHSLGFDGPHGEDGNLNDANNDSLIRNLGYTIEPGIYIEGKFGIRSEIDFYVSGDGEGSA